MKHEDLRGLPPCSLSASCLDWIEELDQPHVSQQVPFAGDSKDQRLLDQLRNHIPGCPTCTAVLAQARRTRFQQRAALLNLLIENEQKVPSTTPDILAAVRGEHNVQRRSGLTSINQPLLQTSGTFSNEQQNGKGHHRIDPPQLSRPRRVLRDVLSLAAVAAIILASVGIFGHFFLRSSNTGHSLTYSNDWDSVVIGLFQPSGGPGDSGNMSIANYNPVNKQSTSLVPSRLPGNTQLDGVSHDGHNLLYHFSSYGHTLYFTLSQLPKTGYFYELNDNDAGNAIWMSDNRHVLINELNSRVVEVDTQTGQAKSIIPTIKTAQLTFYRDNYLYFIGGADLATGALYRVNITGGSPQKVTMPSPGSTFWLSPDGTTVFYDNKGPAGEPGIYAVHTDGTNAHLLFSGDAAPIGYAADNALMLLREVNGEFQVIKLGATPQQQAQVLLTNAAPGGASLCSQSVPKGIMPICNSNIALSPYGHGLILNAYYPDGNHKLLYDDLSTGNSSALKTLSSNTQVQLPGWDRILVPGTLPTGLPTSTVPVSATLGASPASNGWNGVIVITEPGLLNTYIHNYNYLNAQNNLLAQAGPKLQFDGVSPDGHNLLYHVPDNTNHILYYTLTALPNTGFFYELNANNAAFSPVWMDNTHVLISTINNGIGKVDITTGEWVTILPSLITGGIKFYHDGFLYFLGDTDGALYRINISNRAIQKISLPSPTSTFWLSPDGTTIYYVNNSPAGEPGIYAVNSDGTNSRLLRSDGVPIGYAADNALEIMRDVNGKFEVVKLGAIPQQDQVVIADVAPGATSLCNNPANPGITPICDANIALAPYGHALVVQATYAGDSHQLISIDLTTGKRIVLLTPNSNTQVRLGGWDRLQVG